MPLVSRIVEVEGGRYLDGAIADAVPLRFFEEQGYAKNVVILTRPAGYVKDASSAMPLLKLAYRRYPALLRRLAERHLRYNEAVRYAEEQAEAGQKLTPRQPQCAASVPETQFTMNLGMKNGDTALTPRPASAAAAPSYSSSPPEPEATRTP